MSAKHLTIKSGFKQKAKQELVDFAWIALYLTFFFCALVTYAMFLLRNYNLNDSSLNFTFALVNALIIAKVILIGEMAHIGVGAEARPLYQTAVYKAIVYSLLVLAFHFFEEFVRRVIHGKPFGTVWHDIRFDSLISRTVVVFCAFLPLFAFRKLRGVLGEEKLYALFFNPVIRQHQDSLSNEKQKNQAVRL